MFVMPPLHVFGCSVSYLEKCSIYVIMIQESSFLSTKVKVIELWPMDWIPSGLIKLRLSVDKFGSLVDQLAQCDRQQYL